MIVSTDNKQDELKHIESVIKLLEMHEAYAPSRARRLALQCLHSALFWRDKPESFFDYEVRPDAPKQA